MILEPFAWSQTLDDSFAVHDQNKSVKISQATPHQHVVKTLVQFTARCTTQAAAPVVIHFFKQATARFINNHRLTGIPQTSLIQSWINQEQNISTLTTKTLPIIAKHMRAIDFYRVFLARHSSAKRCEMTAICLSGATVSSSSLHRVVFPHAKEPAMMVTGIGSMAGSHDSPSPLNTVFKCLLGGSRGLVVQSI